MKCKVEKIVKTMFTASFVFVLVQMLFFKCKILLCFHELLVALYDIGEGVTAGEGVTFWGVELGVKSRKKFKWRRNERHIIFYLSERILENWDLTLVLNNKGVINISTYLAICWFWIYLISRAIFLWPNNLKKNDFIVSKIWPWIRPNFYKS